MKSFLQFITILEDRLRSPAEVLQRAARRYGPHIKGKVVDPEWGELDKHKLIPLKNYNREKADSAFDKYDSLPSNFPRHKDVSVPIKSINPGQEYVNFSDREKLDKKLASDSDRVIIVKHKDEHYALDGHHKLFTEWGKGKTHITPTEYVDMDGYNPKKR
jgi:hypothetical protein